jgi:hypothetical protein
MAYKAAKFGEMNIRAILKIKNILADKKSTKIKKSSR